MILNVEIDHVDYFHSIEQIRESFSKYLALTGDDGYAVINADDENVMLSANGYRGNKVTFAIESAADMRAVKILCKGGKYSFGIEKKGEFVCHVDLSVTGYHNIYNALACAAAADICGISPEDISRGLGAFCGAKRRMEYKGNLFGAEIYDDYGHHPTEVLTTLNGAKGIAKNRLICLFQPHTYSRTKELFDGFTAAFEAADKVFLSDIYAARETDDGSVSSSMLAEAIGTKAVYSGDLSSSAKMLREELSEGDTLVVMGAGDIYKVFDLL